MSEILEVMMAPPYTIIVVSALVGVSVLIIAFYIFCKKKAKAGVTEDDSNNLSLITTMKVTPPLKSSDTSQKKKRSQQDPRPFLRKIKEMFIKPSPPPAKLIVAYQPMETV